MKTKFLLLLKGSIPFIAFFILLATTVKATDPVGSQNFLAQFAKLERMSDDERGAVFKEIFLNQREIERVLLHDLASTNEDVRFYSAFLLGTYRFASAARPLASIITLEDKTRFNSPWRGGIPPWHYPAAEALERIGSPAIPSLMENLEQSDDAEMRNLSLGALNHIDHDKDVSRLRLQKDLAMQKDAQKQARLQSAIKSLEGMK